MLLSQCAIVLIELDARADGGGVVVNANHGASSNYSVAQCRVIDPNSVVANQDDVHRLNFHLAEKWSA
jgi:hypothetical protein